MVFKRAGTLLFLVILLCSCTRKQAPESEIAAEAAREEAPRSETDLPASDPEAYYRIPIKETPEYHSFIYRYGRMRDEQLPLLEASVKQYGLAVDTASSQSLNRAGYGLYVRKDYANAVRFFREAAYVDPNNVYPHYNLACSLSLLRDSIWADPEKEMRYDTIIWDKDYYADTYQLYEPDGMYYDQPKSDEICRQEIFDHLALACLLDRRYPEKAPADRDLAGLRDTLRFKRLMETIRTGSGKDVYGIWYIPGQQFKACYFMLDGSIQGILPNDRLGSDLYIPLFYDMYKARISRSETTGRFASQITGYEGFAREDPDDETCQWGQEGPYLVFDMVLVEGDPTIWGISREKPDYDYRLIRVVTDVEPGNNAATLRLTDDFEYVNMRAAPYRFILLDDEAGLRQYLAARTPDAQTLNMLAVNALIYDRAVTLDWLLTAYPEIDRGEVFLHSCLFAKYDVFTALEGGAYGFDFEKFFREQGIAMFNHAAGSGNVAFFEMLYAKYFDRVIAPLSEDDARHFKEGLSSWNSTTYNRALFDIIYDIKQGKYHGTF
jgi:hypothetical protein